MFHQIMQLTSLKEDFKDDAYVIHACIPTWYTPHERFAGHGKILSEV
jgi:hypothetical protein